MSMAEHKQKSSAESVIDADNCIAGRLASVVAKRLLSGETIHVVNAEKAIVSGNPDATFAFFEQKIKRGDSYHGPFYPKNADAILRRIVRGMLPYKKPHGKDAYKRLRVYVSVPAELKGRKAEVVETAKNRLDHKFTTMSKIVEKVGNKVEL
jgi:large subunit ribosomal protein L13